MPYTRNNAFLDQSKTVAEVWCNTAYPSICYTLMAQATESMIDGSSANHPPNNVPVWSDRCPERKKNSKIQKMMPLLCYQMNRTASSSRALQASLPSPTRLGIFCLEKQQARRFTSNRHHQAFVWLVNPTMTRGRNLMIVKVS